MISRVENAFQDNVGAEGEIREKEKCPRCEGTGRVFTSTHNPLDAYPIDCPVCRLAAD